MMRPLDAKTTAKDKLVVYGQYILPIHRLLDNLNALFFYAYVHLIIQDKT